MDMGVMAVGYALGRPYPVAEHVAEYTSDLLKVSNWGYRTFHRADAGVGLTDLAADAGKQALDKAAVDAYDVDLVVLAMADIAEYLYWDPSAAVQAKTGAHRAQSVLVNQACCSAMMAFDIAAGKFATRPDCRTALLVAANRVCEDYWNRMGSSTAVSSDGAAAVVLRRDHPRLRHLATDFITDGRYVDYSYLPVGGQRRPFSFSVPDSEAGPLADPKTLMERFLGADPRAMIQFARRNRDNSKAVLERACKRASVEVGDVRHIFHMNGTIKALRDFARDFGVPLDQTNALAARDHGHIGCADQILALGLALEQGSLRSGDLIALHSSGNGMHWACTLLRV